MALLMGSMREDLLECSTEKMKVEPKVFEKVLSKVAMMVRLMVVSLPIFATL